MQEKKPTSISIPKEIHKEIKKIAVEDDIFMGDLHSGILQTFIDNHKKLKEIAESTNRTVLEVFQEAMEKI